MQVRLQDSFFKSLKRLKWHSSPTYRFYSLFRYRLPGFIKNVWRFRRELWQHRWWDYSFTLMMLKRSLEIQEKGMRLKGVEESRSLEKRLVKMRRAIELINNRLEDNYIQRIENEYGELVSASNFEETEDGSYMLVDNETEEEKKHTKMIFDKAHRLEQKEWKELWEIIHGKKYKHYKDWDGSDLRGWWD
jgi:hypothetical protein